VHPTAEKRKVKSDKFAAEFVSPEVSRIEREEAGEIVQQHGGKSPAPSARKRTTSLWGPIPIEV